MLSASVDDTRQDRIANKEVVQFAFMPSPLTKSQEKYATTLPISKEKALLVKVYCLIHRKTIYDFIDELIERELGEFAKRCKELRRQEKPDALSRMLPKLEREKAR